MLSLFTQGASAAQPRAPNPTQVARDLRSAIREAEVLLAELERWMGPPPTQYEAWTAQLPRPGEAIPGLSVRE